MIEMAEMFLGFKKDKEKLATVGENILLKLYGGKRKMTWHLSGELLYILYISFVY